MNRIWLLLVFIFLLAGCSQEQAVVENDDPVESAPVQSGTAEFNVGPVTESGEPAPPAGESNAEPADEPMTPAEELRELKANDAGEEEYLAFAEKHGTSSVAFQALNRLARNSGIAEETKTKLLGMLKENFLENKEADETDAMQASAVLWGLGGEDYRNEVSTAMIDRFLTGKEALDKTANQTLSMLMRQGSAETKQQLTTVLVENFADDPGLVKLVSQMERGVPSPQVEDFLTALSEKSNNEKIQGISLLTLARFYGAIPDFKGFVKDDRFKAQFPEETIEFITNFEPDDYAEKIESMLNRVSEEFGEVDMGRGKTLGEVAADELYVINNLSVGKEAPDIVGLDLDDEEFKLSDYRGKVVMLDFWGDW